MNEYECLVFGNGHHIKVQSHAVELTSDKGYAIARILLPYKGHALCQGPNVFLYHVQ